MTPFEKLSPQIAQIANMPNAAQMMREAALRQLNVFGPPTPRPEDMRKKQEPVDELQRWKVPAKVGAHHHNVNMVRSPLSVGSAKSVPEDKAAILEGMRQIRTARDEVKRKLNVLKTKPLGYAYKPGAQSAVDLQRELDALEDKLDALSEMGEIETLKLQMAMNRMSKMMATLSNILKRISDTSEGITQNLK